MKKTIPLFFAADENYLPYLAVALESIKCNASKRNDYAVHILHSGIGKESTARICALSETGFNIEFNDVSEKLAELTEKLHMRDYYTGATYYRIFIAEMFPQYDKAVYLDSDTVILDDISELYGYELGDNLVGAITDETVMGEAIFRNYVKYALGIEPGNYFNAGILVMNLKKFREDDFYGKFNELLGKYRFTVAQDQDYLNVLCKNKVTYIPQEWNKMPLEPEETTVPKLIHYNLTRKPWHYSNVPYQNYFWVYAERTDFYGQIKQILDDYSEERVRADADCERRLIALAAREAASPTSYRRTYAQA